MDKQEFSTYCTKWNIPVNFELFDKYRDDFFRYAGDDDYLFEFLSDLMEYEKDTQEDHLKFTICAVLRCIMNRARREKKMSYYWAAKLATKMAKRMSRRLVEYKNERNREGSS